MGIDAPLILCGARLRPRPRCTIAASRQLHSISILYLNNLLNGMQNIITIYLPVRQ